MRWFFLVVTLVFLGCKNPAEEPEVVSREIDLGDDQEVGVVLIGDTGTGTSDQSDVANGLAKYCSSGNPCDIGAMLGDNFYCCGVESTDDPQWQEKIEKPYSRLAFSLYAVLGNHDYLGNPGAQLTYRSRVFKMPARYYRVAKGPVDQFFLDSNHMGEDQLKWLDHALGQSDKQWKIVHAHHPIYSYGNHGDTDKLREDLLPILKRHNVDMYVSGHEHDKQVIDRDGMLFVISGAGGKLRPTRSGEYSVWSKSSLGFAHVVFNGNQAVLKMIDKNGNVEFDMNIRN